MRRNQSLQADLRTFPQFRYPKIGHWLILTPDQLYDKYLEFIHNIPYDTTKWTIQLSLQYYQAFIE